MKTLKYRQKFALVSGVFLLPIGLLMTLLFAEIQNRIDFTAKELTGSEYLQTVQTLSKNVLDYRLMSQQLTLTNQPGGQLPPIYSTITQNLNQLALLDQQLRPQLNTQDRVKTIQALWTLLQQRSHEFSPETKVLLSSDLFNAIADLRLHVGDQSNLILDPDLDTYYLMDTVLLKLPEIQETLTQVQLISQQIQLTRQFTPAERAQLLMLTGSLQRFNNELIRKLEIAFNHTQNQTLESQLSIPLEPLTASITTLTQQLNRLAYDRQAPQSDLYFDQANTSLQQSFRLWDQATQQLDLLLENRVNRLKQKRILTSLFVFIVLVLAAYLLLGFYRGIMQVVTSLGLAAQRMIQGDFKHPVQLDSQDELADVVRSFNAIADALREAEANYRGIFEHSVEGIFQTTPAGRYLAANPMLAKIYGYDSADELMQALTNVSRQLYVKPELREQFVQEMQHAGKVQNFEAQVYRKDGSVIWISEAARSVFDVQGQLIRYEGTVVDITQRKAAEAEIAQLTRRLQDENLRMSAELAVTRQLQQMLLPTDLELEAVPGLEIAGFMEPATEVGGDYFDVLHQDGKVSISIGDVTGHGLESGVVMIMAQTAVRTLLANGETDPSKFLNVVNQIIYDNTRRMRSRKNMSLTVMEYEAGSLRLMGQHEELIIVRQDGTVEAIDTLDLGFPLGLEADISAFIQETRVQLQCGDVAVLYTDGITEAMNMHNQQYGLAPMYTILQANRDRSAQDIRQAVIQNVMQHIGEQRVFDDITLVVIKRR
jgi:PAS domain S-box-containing protein